MSRLEQDVRKSHLSSEQGAEELGTYLQWLGDHDLPDSERSFVEFAFLRSGASDIRHFLEAVKQFVPLGDHGQPADRIRWLQTMRLFLNPTDQPWDAPAHAEVIAGYFDTLQAIYAACETVKHRDLGRPVFKPEGVAARARS